MRPHLYCRDDTDSHTFNDLILNSTTHKSKNTVQTLQTTSEETVHRYDHSTSTHQLNPVTANIICPHK